MKNVYCVWLHASPVAASRPLEGGGRFCHLSWEIDDRAGKRSFKVRDYVGGSLYYRGSKASGEPRWPPQVKAAVPLDEIWANSGLRIARTKANRLYVDVKEFDWWQKALATMTVNLRSSPPRKPLDGIPAPPPKAS